MKSKFWRFLVLFLHVLSLICVSSRPFAANDAPALHNQGTGRNPQLLQIAPQSLQITASSNEGKRGEIEEGEGECKERSKMGSKPPSCEHKCYGCMPCEAIQVPTSNTLQYTNYLPEGWKCKCGPTFYTP